MIVVISDTSPVRALHHLGRLSILSDLYSRVVIPPAVQRELSRPPTQFPSIDVSSLPFFEVCAPHDTAHVQRLLQLLDEGESEAIALAAELQAVVLIDEAAGRLTAAQEGVRTLGTLGVLLEGKSIGKVQSVGPLMDRLIRELNFFVSNDVRLDVLRLAGE